MTQTQRTFGLLQYAIIILTLATALIHFALAFDAWFILNGLGYLVLLGALYLPIAYLDKYRGLVRWILIIYTAITVLLWYFTGVRTVIAYVDKIIEVALIILLWLEGQRASR